MKSAHTVSRISPRQLRRLFAAGVFATASINLFSAANTWTGATSGAWDTTTAGNWNGPTTWANGNRAIFTSSGLNQTITVGSGVSLLSEASATTVIAINTGGNYTFGGSTITLANFNGDSIIASAGTGTATFNVNIDYSAGTQGQVRLSASGGNLTFTNGVNTGNRAIQFGGFSSGGTLNLTGGTFTAGSLQFAHSTINISGSATVTSIGQYFHPTGTTNINSATASITAAGNGDNSVIGRTRNTATLNVSNGSVTLSGGVSLMNVESQPDIGNTATIAVSGGRLTVGGNATNGGINLIRGNGVTGDYAGTAVFNQSGGVTTTTRIYFGLGGSVDTGTSATVNLSGGSLYIGTGGITKNAAYTTLATAINLSGGTLGADADWSTSHALTLSDTGGGVTFKTARENGTSQNITLTGSLDGSAGFTKTGAGTLFLNGAKTFTGDVRLNVGTLSSNSAFIADTASLYLVTGSTLNLNFGGTDSISRLFIDGLQQDAGIYNSSSLSSFITGAGSLTVLTAVPEPATVALLAGLAGLTLAATLRRRPIATA